MFQGKCKIWREGDTLHASMLLPTPKGPVEWHKEVKAEPDDEGKGLREIRNEARFVAGFFPTAEMVGQETMDAAEELYRSYLDPQTRPEAEKAIDLLVESADDESAEGTEDNSADLMYAARRLAASDIEKVGWGWGKKFLRKVVKNPVANAVFPPLAAYNVINAARKLPIMRTKLARIATFALAPNMATALIASKAVFDKPPKENRVPELQQQAREALANVEAAAKVQEQAEEATGDYQAYDPDPSQYAPSDPVVPDYPPDEDYDEDMIGFDLTPDLYRQGACDLPYDREEIAGLFSFAKKIGRTIDPTGKGMIGTGIRSAISHIPGVGPEISAGLQLLGEANAGNPKAVDKLETIKDLANSGVPKAGEALQNLKKAQDLQKRMQAEIAEKTNPLHGTWFPGSKLYKLGSLTVF